MQLVILSSSPEQLTSVLTKRWFEDGYTFSSATAPVYLRSVLDPCLTITIMLIMTHRVVSIQFACRQQKHLCCPMSWHITSSTCHRYRVLHCPVLILFHVHPPHEETHSGMDLVINIICSVTADERNTFGEYTHTVTLASHSCIFIVTTVKNGWSTVTTAKQPWFCSSAPNIH